MKSLEGHVLHVGDDRQPSVVLNIARVSRGELGECLRRAVRRLQPEFLHLYARTVDRVATDRASAPSAGAILRHGVRSKEIFEEVFSIFEVVL